MIFEKVGLRQRRRLASDESKNAIITLLESPTIVTLKAPSLSLKLVLNRFVVKPVSGLKASIGFSMRLHLNCSSSLLETKILRGIRSSLRNISNEIKSGSLAFKEIFKGAKFQIITTIL